MNLRNIRFLHTSNLSALDDDMDNDSASSPTTLTGIANCLSGYDPDALSVRDVQAIIGQFVKPVSAIEKVAIRSALDRVLAADIVSPINVPTHDNSAMDGYALRGADLPADRDLQLKIVGAAYAGRAFGGKVGSGECVRIMTGAVIPDGCDTVIPQEFVCDETTDGITVPAGSVRSGDNRRLKGEDLAASTPALSKGKLMRPTDIGLLASLGIPEVPVQRRLRVAFFSTGDELRSVGEPLDEGCIYDSNRYTLYGMLTRLGCDIVDMGVVRDDPASLEAVFRTACENADAVITSGGVSVGAADYTRQMMSQLGDVTFWKLNIRPGRPMAFGRIASNGKEALLFGLPGNPVAVMVTFYFFARPTLRRMMGIAGDDQPLTVKVRAQSAIRKRAGRTEFQRGILRIAEDGMREVQIMGAQGSGILRSMSEANCMVILEHERTDVKPDEMVDVILFDGLI